MNFNYDRMSMTEKDGYVNRIRADYDISDDIFEITILYKSGNHHSFLVTEFEIYDGKCKWTNCDNENKPLKISIEHVEAVFQTGYWKGKSV